MEFEGRAHGVWYNENVWFILFLKVLIEREV